MPVVVITQSRRSVEAKRRAIKAVTDALTDAYGIPAEQVAVYIHDLDDVDWGRGGRLTADLPGDGQAAP